MFSGPVGPFEVFLLAPERSIYVNRLSLLARSHFWKFLMAWAWASSSAKNDVMMKPHTDTDNLVTAFEGECRIIIKLHEHLKTFAEGLTNRAPAKTLGASVICEQTLLMSWQVLDKSGLQHTSEI